MNKEYVWSSWDKADFAALHRPIFEIDPEDPDNSNPNVYWPDVELPNFSTNRIANLYVKQYQALDHGDDYLNNEKLFREIKDLELFDPQYKDQVEQKTQQLIEQNLGLTTLLATKHKPQPDLFIDYIQDGNYVLTKIAKCDNGFDPKLNSKFSTYISKSFRRYIDQNNSSSRLMKPFSYASNLNSLPVIIQTVTDNIENENNNIDVDSVLEKVNNVGRKKIGKKVVSAALRNNGLQFVEPTQVTEEMPPEADFEYESLTIAETIPTPPENDGQITTDIIDHNLSVKNIILNLASVLDDRQLDIIRRHFGFNPSSEPETLEDIARSYNLTRERIRQIESQALVKLRQYAFGQKNKPGNPFKKMAEQDWLDLLT